MRWEGHEEDQKCMQNFSRYLKGSDHLGDLGINGKIILNWISKIKCDDVDWIHVAQDRVQWQAFVNTVMNIQVP
jgi:hypothetical protein